ncbi:MAG: 2-C-methyl-D-erythritol 4-phosphate cytidylyltransferase [Candidatus Omnitrophota bacterium]|nr:2-C-methyl-D-erythritol 4-phosphate cytidylyltransferase [Candidatus Omnitrophota bacterium]MDZ4241545.1 2-C-methyl-D-erythritol 4-phosphate cytidylyltransferase [Candidatus Omnitrophota bacterium]
MGIKIQVIIPAAGSGTRLKASVAKPLVLLAGKPLVVHSLEVFQKSPVIHSIIVVTRRGLIGRFQALAKRFRISKVVKILAGGATRSDSVYEGLKAVDADTDVVAVHDAARPLLSAEVLSRALQLCRKEPAVIVAVPVKSTVKKADPKNLHVLETLPRDVLWEAQTPQIFRKDILFRAHQARLCCEPTDDAVLVEKMGVRVKILKGDDRNIKVTTRTDLAVAEVLLKLKGKLR